MEMQNSIKTTTDPSNDETYNDDVSDTFSVQAEAIVDDIRKSAAQYIMYKDKFENSFDIVCGVIERFALFVGEHPVVGIVLITFILFFVWFPLNCGLVKLDAKDFVGFITALLSLVGIQIAKRKLL